MANQFRRQSKLYLLGAGTSAPDVKFGVTLVRDPAIVFVQGGSFFVDIPVHSDLGKRLIAADCGSAIVVNCSELKTAVGAKRTDQAAILSNPWLLDWSYCGALPPSA